MRDERKEKKKKLQNSLLYVIGIAYTRKLARTQLDVWGKDECFIEIAVCRYEVEKFERREKIFKYDQTLRTCATLKMHIVMR